MTVGSKCLILRIWFDHFDSKNLTCFDNLRYDIVIYKCRKIENIKTYIVTFKNITENKIKRITYMFATCPLFNFLHYRKGSILERPTLYGDV